MSHQVDQLQIVIGGQGIDQEESAPGTAPTAPSLALLPTKDNKPHRLSVNCSSSRSPGKLRAPNAHRPVILGLAVLTATDSRIRTEEATRREIRVLSPPSVAACTWGWGQREGVPPWSGTPFFHP